MRTHILAVALLTQAAVAVAQDAETPKDTVVDIGWMLTDANRGGLTLTSGKTYNRVEGLPILFGPTFQGRIGSSHLSIAALGIVRSAHNFHWDSENLGHRLSASLRESTDVSSTAVTPAAIVGRGMRRRYRLNRPSEG